MQYLLVGMGVLVLCAMVIFFPEVFALLARAIRAVSGKDVVIEELRVMGPDVVRADRDRFLHPRGMYWRSRGR